MQNKFFGIAKKKSSKNSVSKVGQGIQTIWYSLVFLVHNLNCRCWQFVSPGKVKSM